MLNEKSRSVFPFSLSPAAESPPRLWKNIVREKEVEVGRKSLEKEKTLIIYGGMGTGKTYLVGSLINNNMFNDYLLVWLSFPNSKTILESINVNISAQLNLKDQRRYSTTNIWQVITKQRLQKEGFFLPADAFRRQKKKLLVVLDGLDEKIDKTDYCLLVDAIQQKGLNSRLIITTRYPSKEMQKSKTILLGGFSLEESIEYREKYFPNIQVGESDWIYFHKKIGGNPRLTYTLLRHSIDNDDYSLKQTLRSQTLAYHPLINTLYFDLLADISLVERRAFKNVIVKEREYLSPRGPLGFFNFRRHIAEIKNLCRRGLLSFDGKNYYVDGIVSDYFRKILGWV